MMRILRRIATVFAVLLAQRAGMAQLTGNVEGVTGLSADVTPLLSIAGVWQPVPDQYISAPPNFNGSLANTYLGNIRLSNGKEGLAIIGWAFNGYSNAATTPLIPINVAVLEQQADGRLSLATSKYIADPLTNGGGSVVVADLNGDGVDDLFLAPYNETPNLPASSIAYLSNLSGTFTKVTVGDLVNAHDAELAYIRGVPTIYTGSAFGVPGLHDNTVVQFNGAGGFIVDPDTADTGSSSVAVADFYGDGTYSAVYGDLAFGLNYPYTSNYIGGIYLYHLAGLVLAGDPINVGNPYFNTPAYSSYQSFTDPHGKQHSPRVYVEDFNHDGMLDILVQGTIWSPTIGTQQTVLQMFQNTGSYQFKDVTDSSDPQYDKAAEEFDYTAQRRDIDNSGINSFLSAGVSYKVTQPAANYVIVNDGSGNLQTALHQTLNQYAQQIVAWLNANHPPEWYVPLNSELPKLRAYQTPNGRLNFLAVVDASAINSTFTHEYILVNVPLQLDIPTQFTKPLTVKNRNGSHLIRTFAGDDTIYSGNNGGYSRVDGGLGTNTVIYSGPRRNYSISVNGDGSWTVKDDIGQDGTDTLVHIQRLQFSDTTVALNQPPTITSVSIFGGGQAGVVPGSFVSIYGSSFTVSPFDDWSQSINGRQLPSQLDGTSVTIGGKAAFICAITPGEIDVQAPDVPAGSAQVVVSTPFGTSAAFNTTVLTYSPVFFLWPGNQPVATHPDDSPAAKDGTLAGTTTVPAKPGEVLTLWATGLGPANPPTPSGQLPGPNAGAHTQYPVTVTLGGASVPVLSATLSQSPGVYQIAIQIPASLVDGDYPLVAFVGAVSSPTVALTVRR